MRRPGSLVLLLAVAALLIVLDQATKAWAVAALSEREIPVIEGVLHWRLQRNPGAAFGLFQRFPVVFTVLATAISAYILAIARTVTDRAHAIALGLVLGGALGNLVDRLVRPPGFMRGHVIDFIDLRVWPVFNVADIAVVSGAILLVLVSWRRPARSPQVPVADDARDH